MASDLASSRQSASDSHLLGDELEKFDENAADVNGDGTISVGDITALAEYMLSSSLLDK